MKRLKRYLLRAALILATLYAATLGALYFAQETLLFHPQILAALPRDRSADGNAVLNTLQQLAGAVGTSVAASLVAAAQRANPEQLAAATRDGSRHAFILLAVLALMALISVSLALCRHREAP